jgi:hypothetical protein
LFTGFKYPWKWIDDLHITEKEKLEIIENNWRTAYTPLISWCSENATTGNKKSASKKNIISLMGDEKKCLEDKYFRIELINKPKIKTKKNEILNKWFNEIPPNVKNFSFEIENISNYKTENFIIETNLFQNSSMLNLDESDLDLNDDIQVICAYSLDIKRYEGNDCRYYSLDLENKIFSIDFLSKKYFTLLSKGCFNSCMANITYITDTEKYIIRGLKILKPNLMTWPKYSDKDSKKIIEYDSMINKTHYLVNELKKHHSKPGWFANIEIK